VDLPYQPFWCEENAWQVCQDPRVPGRRHALIVTGEANVAVWAQRAAPAGMPVAWDYHVLVFAESDGVWTAWDPDCVHGPVLPAARWLAVSFPCPERVPAGLQPRFRLVEGEEYVANLRSDRSHMRDARGGWQRPPPPWPPPGDGGMNLAEWLAAEGGCGRRFDLDGLRALVKNPLAR